MDRLTADLEDLKRQAFGKKSEKLPPMDREVRAGEDADPAQTQAVRQERALLREKLLTERIVQKVPEDERRCPQCGNAKLRPVGDGKQSVVYEYVPGHFRRCVYLRETLSCSCGSYIVTAPPPDKSTDRTRYGPGFVAHLMVSKCADSIPMYRLEKGYDRIGIPIARSTMTDLFHRNAELLAPLSQRLREIVASSPVVQADETSIKMLDQDKRTYLWTFLAGSLIAYKFSPDRSGTTPSEVLGASIGTLVVDMYTGYNRVTSTGRRTRAGCLAHARRKIFSAREGIPEAQVALDLIRDVYRVERDAKAQRIVGTAEHLDLRRTRSRPLMDKLHEWLSTQQGLHPPRSKMGRALRYSLKNWTALTRFLDDANVPPDNNRSEAALRRVALGRKNFLFVGNEDAGDNIAGVYSLVATCEANGVNPFEYLRDVLIRVSTHPAARIDELLPHHWTRSAS
jgi:transposase